VQREHVASVVWSTLADVGGIPVVRLLKVYLHPLRLQLEERVGRKIKDYMFVDRIARRREAVGLPRNDSSSQAGSKTNSHLELVPLNRSKSAVSVNSSVASSTENRSVSISSRHPRRDRIRDQFASVPQGDAAEMSRRSKSTKHFIKIELATTTFVITHKVSQCVCATCDLS
jgi:hypothetical protein